MRKATLDNNDLLKENKSKKYILKLVIWFFIFTFLLYQLIILVKYTFGKKAKEEMWLYNKVNSIIALVIKKQPSQTIQEFNLTLAALGDIYVTPDLIKVANNYDFNIKNEKIVDQIKSYDIVLASLSTPVASKELGYSTTSIYNAPNELLKIANKLNISIFATATNHIMDKNEKGIINTINEIEKNKIKQIGINTQTRSKPQIIEKNGIKIGILSYATKSNVKIPKEKEYLVNMLTDVNLQEDIKFLKENDSDFIISYLNIPNENNLLVSGMQKANVEKLFNSGVNIVLGSGSLVVQEAVEDEIIINEEKSHVYAIYSLGNFIGINETDNNKLSVIPNFIFDKKIIKNKKGEIIKSEKVFKVKKPISIWTSANRKVIYNIEDEIKSYNSDNSAINIKEYEKLKNANKRINLLFNID